MRPALLLFAGLVVLHAQSYSPFINCTSESSLPTATSPRRAVEFVNQTGQTVHVYLQNELGQRLFIQALAPGDKFSHASTEGQPLILTDTSGRCLEVQQPDGVDSRAYITTSQRAAGASAPIIQTYAGTDFTFQSDGQAAVSAPFGQPQEVAVDGAGNYYFADLFNQAYRVTPDSVVHILAGNGFASCCSNGIDARNASIRAPQSINVGPNGDIYIGGGGYIQKVSRDGTISSVIGTGSGLFGGDGGPAITATVGDIQVGIVFDGSGNLYFSDTRNNRVRKIDSNGVITTVAGNGQLTSSGDGGLATSAGIGFPRGLRFDSAGNLYISEYFNNKIRKVTRNGTITTFLAGVAGPADLDFDSAGNLYIAESVAHHILKVSPDGQNVTLLAGTTQGFSGDGGPATRSQLNTPSGLRIDGNGNILIADSRNGRIRRITSDGVISTIAGNGLFRFSPDGTPARLAFFEDTFGLAVSPSGLLYVSDRQATTVYRIESDGSRKRVVAGLGESGNGGNGPSPASTTGLVLPQFLSFDRQGNLYIADYYLVRKVTPDGVMSTVAGGGSANPGDGGSATNVFLVPTSVVADSSGNLYIAEGRSQQAQRIRKVAPDGTISTFAGTGAAGFQDGPGAQATFNGLRGMAMDAAGNLYVADSNNNRVRKISPNGIVSTYAGGGAALGDGVPATQANLFFPSGLAFDPGGALLVTQPSNEIVRRITPDGIISTIAGNGQQKFAGDGGPAQLASFFFPEGLAADSVGNIFIADSSNYRVRVIPAAIPSLTAAPSSLAVTVKAGARLAVSQPINLTSSVVGLPYVITIQGGFLSASASSGATPASVQLTVDATRLGPGNYSGTIIFTPSVNGAAPATVSVSLTVQPAAPSQLGVDTAGLSFPLVHGGPTATKRAQVLNTGGGSIDFTASATTDGKSGNWLSVSPSRGTSTAAAPVSLTVTADPGALPAGTYTGSVIIADSSGSTNVSIHVTATVSQSGQLIRLSQSGLTFTGVVDAGVSPPQKVVVLNAGKGAFGFNAIVKSSAGASGWLSVTPANGTSDASQPFPTLSVAVNPAGLSAGDYYGLVEVTSPTADNSPQYITVVLHQLPDGSDPGPIVQPAGLLFTAVAGGSDPASQTIQVSNISSTPVSFGSGVATLDGGNYIAYQPAFSALPTGSLQIVVQPTLGGLTAGIYRGAITLVFSDGGIQTVAILIVLAPPGSLLSSSDRTAAASSPASCTPTKLLPLITSLGSNFNVPASFPTFLAARVVDDCASPVTTGSFVSSFSNGDPPLSLIALGDGNWTATWLSGNTRQQVTITGTVDTLQPPLHGAVQVNGSLSGSAAPPMIAPGGIISASSFALQKPLAPGAMVSIFGSQLGTGVSQAQMLPLGTQLAGASLVVAGQAAPLLFASDGQVNALLPFGVPVNTQAQVIVINGSQISFPAEISIGAAQPGVFTLDGTGRNQGHIYVIAPDGSSKLAGTSSPAKAGDEVVIYCSGLGPVNVPVVDGTASPFSPIAYALNTPTVTIGGTNARVDFAGLTPGFAGLYQIDAAIPAGLTPGDQVPVVITSAGQSSPPVTMAVR